MNPNPNPNPCDVIRKYFNDYLTQSVITQSEIHELRSLFEIIWTELGLGHKAPTVKDLLHCLNRDLIVIPLDLDLDKDNVVSSYIDLLHQREFNGDQRTDLWKQTRYKYITASVSAACAGLMGTVARDNQLLEKASMGSFSSFAGGYYTDIGNIYEPVTNYEYCYKNNTRIHDFGLIPNNKAPYEFLAASTDGVAENGCTLTNIEIKTLPGRVPDGKVKKQYYHQMQHQMECLGLDHSDFVEAKYCEAIDLNDLNTGSTLPIGIIAELWNTTDNEYVYEYSPAGIQYSELSTWLNQRDEIIREYNDRILTRWIYWTETHYSCIRVERDPKWIITMGPLLLKFYNQMVALRNNQKEVQRMIRERDIRTSAKRNGKNELFSDCML